MMNEKFGMLTVTNKLPPDPKWRRSMWECRCDCGTVVVRTGVSLRKGKNPNCGCVHPVVTRNTFRKYGTVEECMANTVQIGDCLEWLGHRTSAGYAMLGSYTGKYTMSLPSTGHRRVFFLLHGYLPEVVMHTCDNPPCINPAHLRAGTKKTNSQDSVNKGRFNQSKRKYKVIFGGVPVSLAEYSAKTGIPMATLQWQARHGKLPLVGKEHW